MVRTLATDLVTPTLSPLERDPAPCKSGHAISKVKVKTTSEEETTSFHTTTTRRKLGGPGSSPPRCAWKCGRCTPCKPVHVPVPPGTPVTAEYYPEAWRCKCGNKLYMP
uniref:Epidermal patterning factor-like protein n=1 Tax=Lactuca sativa TaxID=4236 RepID=A0A9R1VIR7_LACSA|nr:hypothetical protein LSAT_V11C500292830 [Lactuca sativa]